MTTREAFLAAIHAAPDDDLPRIVFADWLDENGEPERAAFVRRHVADPTRPARARTTSTRSSNRSTGTPSSFCKPARCSPAGSRPG